MKQTVNDQYGPISPQRRPARTAGRLCGPAEFD